MSWQWENTLCEGGTGLFPALLVSQIAVGKRVSKEGSRLAEDDKAETGRMHRPHGTSASIPLSAKTWSFYSNSLLYKHSKSLSFKKKSFPPLSRKSLGARAKLLASFFSLM